jgi:hypothetical protein
MPSNTHRRPPAKDPIDRLFGAIPVVAILLIIFALGSAFFRHGL